MPDFRKKLDGSCCLTIVQAFAHKQRRKFAEAVEELYDVSPAVRPPHQLKSRALRLAEDPAVFPEETAAAPPTCPQPDFVLPFNDGKLDLEQMRLFLEQIKSPAGSQPAKSDAPYGV